MAPQSYLGAIDQGTTSTRFIVFDGSEEEQRAVWEALWYTVESFGS